MPNNNLTINGNLIATDLFTNSNINTITKKTYDYKQIDIIDEIYGRINNLEVEMKMRDFKINDLENKNLMISNEIKELRKICARTNTALMTLIADKQVEKFNKDSQVTF